MRDKKRYLKFAGGPAAALVLFLSSCGQGVEYDPPAEPAPEESARLMPIPDTGGKPMLPAPPPGSGIGETGIRWELPGGWQEETPSSNVRRAQYNIPGPAGDGECVVFYFGPGQGGGPLANAQRWASQFHPPDGGDSLSALKTEERNFAGFNTLWVEVRGTYENVMTGEPPMENAELLGAIVEGPDASWFFKFTGPVETVERNRAAFENLLNSLHR